MILRLFLVISILLVISCQKKKNTYVAASMHLVDFSTPDQYSEYVSEAKNQGSAEIIVFPELSLGAGKEDGENVTLYSNPCIESDPKTSPRQYHLSCAAKTNHIYVVLSLLEYSGDKIYNCAITFDRSGKIIAKYRKRHVLLEFLTPGNTPPIYFDTDFGVRFGMFVCFDILFLDPSEQLPSEKYKINNFVYPTFWVKSQPFLALQTQQSFSEFFRANLIASNDIKLSLGTGHFSRGKALNWSMNKTSNHLLISEFEIFEWTPLPKVPSIPSEWEGPKIWQKWFFVGDDSSVENNLHISTQFFDCNLSYSISVSKNKMSPGQWFTFYAFRSGPPKGVIEEEYKSFIIYENLCGVIVCDQGNNTALSTCFSNQMSTITFFENLELSMTTVKDDVRSVRTLMATDKAELFLQNEYSILHDDYFHSVKMEKSNQPLLFATVVSLLKNFLK